MMVVLSVNSSTALRPCNVMKAMVVGEKEAGKTSFVRALQHVCGGGLLSGGNSFMASLPGMRMQAKLMC